MCDHNWELVSSKEQEIEHYNGTTTFTVEVYECSECGKEKSEKYPS